ncbi:hypothetical protein PGTUg99_003420 [Puccinia graminis f. sp. tritici]|uniref:Uncharacterized protein n=1 Tax=Puccinia graminis f. sp. tritici TaxID=56615 RepID=A0A5B0RSZ5_PUCGR|nr:hypothetical protein PGTUg99_003420 [Puccinia graminis f. sp. tritici]
MSSFFEIPDRFDGQPLSPYSLHSEPSTAAEEEPMLSPDPETFVKAESPDEDAVASPTPASVANSESSCEDGLASSTDIRRRVEDHVPTPRPPPPTFSDIRLFAIAAAFQVNAEGQFPFHYQERYARSPSPPTSSDAPGSGTASSPIRVDTPPPAEPCYVYPPLPDPDHELTPEERGPIWAEIVQEDAVLNARRHIKAFFRSYFELLDGDVLNHPRRSGGYRRLARCRLYENVMEELDRVLETVDQVQMTVIE